MIRIFKRFRSEELFDRLENKIKRYNYKTDVFELKLMERNWLYYKDFFASIESRKHYIPLIFPAIKYPFSFDPSSTFVEPSNE